MEQQLVIFQLWHAPLLKASIWWRPLQDLYMVVFWPYTVCRVVSWPYTVYTDFTRVYTVMYLWPVFRGSNSRLRFLCYDHLLFEVIQAISKYQYLLSDIASCVYMTIIVQSARPKDSFDWRKPCKDSFDQRKPCKDLFDWRNPCSDSFDRNRIIKVVCFQVELWRLHSRIIYDGFTAIITDYKEIALESGGFVPVFKNPGNDYVNGLRILLQLLLFILYHYV